MHAFAAGELEHTLDDVLPRVQNDVVRAVLLRERGLLGRRGRADDGRARALGELREEQAEAARDGVHEHEIARLDAVRLLGEGHGRQALQRGGGAGEEGDVRGEREDFRPGDGDVLGVHPEVVLPVAVVVASGGGTEEAGG